MEGSIRCSANYDPLTSISFLERSAIVYGDNLSIVYGDDARYTWKQTLQRCTKIASAISHLGVSPGDVSEGFGFLTLDNFSSNSSGIRS
ncbi:hypothetical protein K1719_020702 [Acacia pycnantha]|nr:hypothetical protein K1719_020702 [Acacia pycnantha]